MEFIDLKAQYRALKTEIDANIQAVLDSARFIGGPYVEEVEKRLAAYVGREYCVTCANGTDALQAAFMAAGAGAGDAVRLACFPPEEWQGVDKLELDALTEFKRGSNGVVELKFVDRGRLLERLLDTVDHSGQDQVDRFLQAMEGER